MTVQPIVLRTDILTDKAKASHKSLKDQVVSDHGKMQAAAKKTDRGMLEISGTASKLTSVATAGLSSIAAGFSAAQTAQEGFGSSSISLVASLAASFGAGGPLGLAIGGLSAGIGLLIGEQQRQAEEARKAALEYQRTLDATIGKLDSVLARERALLDAIKARRLGLDAGDVGEFDDAGRAEARLLAKREELQRKLQASLAKEAAYSAQFGGSRSPVYERETKALRQQLENLKPLIAAERARAEAVVRMVVEKQREARAVADVAREERRLQEIRAHDPVNGPAQGPNLAAEFVRLGEKRLAVERRLAAEADKAGAAAARLQEKLLAGVQRHLDLQQRIRKEKDAQAQADAKALSSLQERTRREIELLGASPGAREGIRGRHRFEDLRAELAALGGDPSLANDWLTAFTESLNQQAPQSINESSLQGFTRQLTDAMQPISYGLTDLLTDGITNGFRNGSDIAKNIMDSLLRTLIQQVVSSGLQQLMAGVLGGSAPSGGFSLGSVITTAAAPVFSGAAPVPSGSFGGTAIPPVTGGCGPGG